MLTHRQLAARRAAWFARHRKTYVRPYLGQTATVTANDPFAQMTDQQYTDYWTAMDAGQTPSIAPSASASMGPGTDPGYSDSYSGATGSGITSGWGGILSNIGNFFKGGASSPPQSYAAAQGAPLTPANGSYSATVQTPGGTYGASVTTPQSTPHPSTFSLSSLTDFSTPWPYILIGGGILLLAKSRGGGGGSGGSENFIKL